MTFRLAGYGAVWLVDFEFHVPPGERPQPICLVAGFPLRQAGATVALGATPTDSSAIRSRACAIYTAFYMSAELGCHLALDWPMPARALDLYCEFRNRTNGMPLLCGSGLLGALAFFGLGAIDAAEKEEMRALAMRGGPYTAAEQQALLDYCQTDVDALAKLLPAMLPKIDMSRALLRGRYMGVPHGWSGPARQST